MNEAETIEALADIAMNCATFFSVYVSLSFAYFTVAYIVGRVLTGFQLTLINLVYGLAQALIGTTFVIWVRAFELLHAREETVLREIWVLNQPGWFETSVVLLLLVFAASIYFMHDIRRRTPP